MKNDSPRKSNLALHKQSATVGMIERKRRRSRYFPFLANFWFLNQLLNSPMLRTSIGKITAKRSEGIGTAHHGKMAQATRNG